MIINLFIKENRKVEIKEKEIGVVGDNNATTLVFKYSSGVLSNDKLRYTSMAPVYSPNIVGLLITITGTSKNSPALL